MLIDISRIQKKEQEIKNELQTDEMGSKKQTWRFGWLDSFPPSNLKKKLLENS